MMMPDYSELQDENFEDNSELENDDDNEIVQGEWI